MYTSGAADVCRFGGVHPAAPALTAATGSNNALVDSHLVSIFALVVIAACATTSAGYLGRLWADLPLVRRQPWLR